MRRRKKLLPVLLFAVFLWIGFGYFIYAFSPNSPLPLFLPLDPKVIFFLILFLALFLSFSLLLNNSRRGTLIAAGLTIIALLRFFQLFHPLYIIFVIAILVTVEIYFLKR